MQTTRRVVSRETTLPNLQRLLTTHQAAGYLSMSYWHVREMLAQGSLPFVRCGRRVMIDRKDLEEWIEQSKERNR
jgi:excisionase family DNA binding protein